MWNVHEYDPLERGSYSEEMLKNWINLKES